MKTMSLKKNDVALGRMLHPRADQDCTLHAEEEFHRLLAFERKRSERSGKRMYVMLIDISGLDAGAEKAEVTRSVTRMLFSRTRETDIKGWYSGESVFGLLFTEVNGVDKDSLLKKMQSHLRTHVREEPATRIKLSIHVFPEEDNDQQPRVPTDFTLYPDLAGREKSRRASLFLKRLMDIAGSAAGIILLSPLFVLISLCIKLTSPGPVFFRQERLGQYGRPFTFLKFRTMVVGNDPDVHKQYIKSYISGNAYAEEDVSGEKKKVFKITNDKRVTSIGGLLRKTSLDELPQFFNVLRGEMSLVGPRPPIPYEIEGYDVWHRRRVIEIKPGITGLWQVTGRSSTTFDEMVRLDLQYDREWSLWLDIKILLQTPRAVIAGKGAY